MAKTVFVLLALGLVVVTSSKDAGLDWVVDLIIDNIREDMLKNNVSRAPVPDFEKTITEKFLGIQFTAEMSAKNGSLGNITTVERRSTAEIAASGSDDSVTIISELGLREMDVSYESFTAHAWGARTQGKMSAKCYTDSFALSVTAKSDYYGKCTTTVNYANLTSLGKCTVTVGEGGFTNWFRGYLFQFLLNHYESDIATIVNGQIESVFKQNIEKQDMCKYLRAEHLITKDH